MCTNHNIARMLHTLIAGVPSALLRTACCKPPETTVRKFGFEGYLPYDDDDEDDLVTDSTAFEDLRVFLSEFFDRAHLPCDQCIDADSKEEAVNLLVLELIGRENSNVQSLLLREMYVNHEFVDKLLRALGTGVFLES